MRTIYKYPLEITDIQSVEMPKGAQILCVQMQNGTPCLWAMVDPDRPMETRGVITIGTGHQCNADGYTYVGTYRIVQPVLVFHVFAS